MSRSLLVLATVLVALIALFGLGGALVTSAAGATIDCEIPQSVVCDVSDSDGIQSVKVSLETALGVVVVVDESYNCESQVQVSWDPIVPNFDIEVADCAGQGDRGLSFAGLMHRPLGPIRLTLEGSTLVASSFNRAGDTGLLVELGAASRWEGLLLPAVPPTEGGSLTVAAIGQGSTEPASTIEFRTANLLSSAPTPYTIHPTQHMTDVIVWPISFQAPTYETLLYNEGDLVYEQGNIPSGTAHVNVPEWFCEAFDEILDCTPRLTFAVDPATGACFWEVALPQPILVETPSGPVETDRLRFVEEEEASQTREAPMVFERIEMYGQLLPSLTIFDEAVGPPLPPDQAYLPMVRTTGTPSDPFGLDALSAYLASDPAPGSERRINDSLLVRVVGSGELVDEMVEMPGTPRDDQPEGERDPQERPANEVPAAQQTLRLFDTTREMEYEIVVEGPLLERIHTLQQVRGATGAHLPLPDSAADALLGSSRVRLPTAPLEPGDADGWSNGDDSRVRLTATTAWPWRTIAHFSNGCSGTLIGPRHILTAAHCINKRGTNQWYTFSVSPGRNATSTPYGSSTMNPNPQPGDPFRWYFTPAQWRSAAYNDANCAGNCYAATEWDWGLIIIPDYLGYQTGWMGYVARPAGSLNPQYHYNRGYPVCGTSKGNAPDGCVTAALYGDSNTCSLGSYSFQGSDGWHRVIRNSCDLSGGHSGSAVYHYFYDTKIQKTVPVVAMVEVWEHCYTCSSSDNTPNSARRLTPNDLSIISFFRQWAP